MNPIFTVSLIFAAILAVTVIVFSLLFTRARARWVEENIRNEKAWAKREEKNRTAMKIRVDQEFRLAHTIYRNLAEWLKASGQTKKLQQVKLKDQFGGNWNSNPIAHQGKYLCYHLLVGDIRIVVDFSAVGKEVRLITWMSNTIIAEFSKNDFTGIASVINERLFTTVSA